MIYGIWPRVTPEIYSIRHLICLHGGAEAFMDTILDTHTQSKANSDVAVAKYKMQQISHWHRLVIKVGDLVCVILKNDCMSSHADNELKARKIGLVEVLECINDNAYWTSCRYNSSDMFNVKYLSRYFPPDQVPDSWLNPSHLGNLMQHHLHRHNHDIFPILFFLVFFIISLLDNY